MNNSPLVSIIVPVYNSSKFLKDTIKSIEEQTYKNYEVIFIDDCSSDNSVQIIENYAKENSKVHIIKLKRNRGTAIARNIGIRKAKGRYLSFLDSDDYWIKEKLDYQIKFITENDYEFIYSSYRYMSSDGEKISTPIKITKKIDYKYILADNGIAMLTVMIDLEKIPKRYCYFPTSNIEDLLNWWSILKKGYVAYGQEQPLALYRKVKNSRGSNKFEMIKYRWQAYRKQEKFSIFKSMYYLLIYAIKATLKRINSWKWREKYEELEVAVSTMNLYSNEEIEELMDRLKIKSEYLVINQIENQNTKITNPKVINRCEKGLSRSRNVAINNLSSEIVCLADDDIVYEEDYKQTILEAHNKYRKADIICFYVESKNPNRKTKRMHTGKVGYIRSMRIFSPEITFKKDAIIKNGLKFDENFGAGAFVNRGEEQLFIYSALKKKMKVLFINKKIGEVYQEESTWFNGFDEEFFKKQGILFKEMSPKFYKLYIIQYAIRKYFLYQKKLSISKAVKLMMGKEN